MMKKLLLFLMLVVSFNMNAQLTSLTIDNQTPGWLSSKINYGDQQTLKNITITGYLNGTDLKFIRELNTLHNLRGVIDLADANIVAGGDIYYDTYTTKTNVLTGYAFADLDSLQKVVLPKSLTAFDGGYDGYQFLGTYVDTLVINGSMEELTIGNMKSNKYSKTRCVYIPEGVKSLSLYYLFSSNSGLKNQEIFFPSTLESVYGYVAAKKANNIVFHCSSMNPEIIKEKIYNSSDASLFEGGTIYVPKGTTEKYKNSIFKKLTIIEEISVESLHINTHPNEFHVGDSFSFSATVLPSNALVKDVTWSSGNESIASITNDGLMTALSYGDVWIYAHSVENPEIVDSCLVNIKEHTNGVAISTENTKVHIGGKVQLSAKTLPEGTSDGLVIWSCNNESIATVDANGLVTGLKQGSCVVTATSVDGGFTAECTVTVMQPVTNVNLYKHELDLKVGQSETLRVDVLPSNADDKSLTWKSDNDSIAIVDERGKITGLASGKVKIYAISNDNNKVMDYCDVTVTQPVSGLKLNYSKYEIKGIGSTVKLEATVIPEDATNKEVRWVSSNDAVCMVSAGNVVATGLGTAVIIATTVDGGYMATCTITVIEGQTYPTGDVNEDGVVDVADVNAVINMMLHLQETNNAADVNGDGIIDVADLNMIINKILGI